MARHNRLGRGTDQRGADYVISYQPDWLQQVKVTRALENGRQSTKTVFRNHGEPGPPPGPWIKTRIMSRTESLEFEIDVNDPHGVVKRIVVETEPGDSAECDTIQFTIEQGGGRRKLRQRFGRRANSPQTR